MSHVEKEIIFKIKQKKEFSGLPDKLVSDLLKSYLLKSRISLNLPTKKDMALLVKEIRKNLRNLTGQFQIGFKNRKKLLESEKIIELLRTHSSTSERLDFYNELKKIIKPLKVNSILDLACGLNPIAFAEKGITYHASDIREDELSLIKSYFEKNHIKGDVFVFDLSENPENLPESDLCLLFKVLDVVDKWPYKISENILKKVKCKYFLVSFATKKLSGKNMNFPERKWFESILNRLGYSYKKILSEKELFYLIEKG